MIKQVIFDLGRVLLDWEPENLAHELTKKHDIFHREVWEITKHPSWLDFDMGLIRAQDLITLHANRYPVKSLELFMEHVPYILTPQSEGLRLLDEAKKRGLKCYILSNMSIDFYEHLVEAYPFLNEFDGSVYSCHYNIAKPDPQIYQTILKKYDLIPQETLFIDDVPGNIEAAKALGIDGIVFTKDEKTFQEFLRKIEFV